jgi:transaldolase
VKFFADTAEVSEIRLLAGLGLLDGVTTNPSLIVKSGRKMDLVMNRPGFTGGQNSWRIAHYGTDTKEEDREAVFT